MARAETCSRCEFENPPTFPACARCNAPFGVAAQARTGTGTGRISSDEFAVDASSELGADEAFAAAERGVLGRDAEVARIRALVAEAFSTRRPRLIVLEGERGSGTTRLLIHTAHLALGIEPRTRLLHGVCVEGREGELAPLDRMLLDRFQVTPSSSELAARARVTTEVGEALGATDAATVSHVAHLVGRAAGLEFPDSPVLRGLEKNPDELRARTRAAVVRFLSADAQATPLWIGLDNARRVDPSTFEVLAALLAVEAPIVILCAGDEVSDALRAAIPDAPIDLVPVGRLGDDAVAALVRRLVPDLDELPEALVSAITHRAQGLPSEVRQLVFALYEGELFVPGPGGRLRVDLPRLERGELPISMDDALHARLARLEPTERDVLAMASVCGEAFWDGALLCQMRMEAQAPGSAYDEPDPETDAQGLVATLGQLVAKGFLQPVAPGGVVPANEYRFSTPRVRTLVYAAMSEPVRRARHLHVARWLDVAAVQRRDAVSATVGFHLEVAGELAAAAAAYVRAAQLERRLRRHAHALTWLERAEACTPAHDPMTRLDVAHDRGAVLATLGRTDEAVAAFAQMHDLARSLGARAKQAAAIDRIARAHLATGQAKRALPLLEVALGLVQRAGDRRGIASCLDDLAQVELVLGHVPRAHMAATEALELRRALGDARGESLSLTTLGRIALRQGELSRADERLRTALALREGLEDVEGVLATLVPLGRVAFERGDRELAIEPWQRAIALAREVGDRAAERAVLSHLAEAHLLLGRLAAAESHATSAKELAVAADDRRGIARCDVLLGRIALRRGDERTGRLLRLAVEAAEQAGAADVLGLARRALAQHYVTRVGKDSAAGAMAIEQFEASLASFRAADATKELARTKLDYAHLRAQLGRTDDAETLLREALAILEPTQLPEAVVAAKMLANLR